MFEFLTQSVNLSVNERERIGALTIEEVEFLLLVWDFEEIVTLVE